MVVRFSCLLCGAGIFDSSDTKSKDWLCEYRAVYRKGIEALVSGVAHYRDHPDWAVPVDPSLRWDDVAASPDKLLVLPVMSQAAADGVYGFVLHDRLLKVCESLPFPLWYNGLNWGHDYCGRLELDNEIWYPWKEMFVHPDVETLDGLGVLHDPLHGPDLSALLLESSESMPRADAPTDPGGRNDCFSRLPWELRVMILVNLKTKDAFNLRQASGSFQFLFSSHAFWLSRFDPDGETGFLFEAREKAVANDTGSLLRFYRFSKRNLSSSFANRQRVWALARRLLPLIRPPIMSNTSNTQLDTDDAEEWTTLSSSVYLPTSPATAELAEPPRYLTTTSEIQMPPGPVVVGIAVVNTGIWDYITGIRIIDRKSGQKQFAGYLFDSGERLRYIETLHGFRLAMGPCGTHLVDNDAGSQSRDMSLRQVAIWYPKPPPDNLVLNENSFTGLWPDPLTYQPLSWLHFGGFKGANLPCVQGILVSFRRALHGLQFVYDREVPETGEAASERFGRSGPKKMEDASLFSIDGAGGERISSISVGLCVSNNDNVPEYLRHGIVRTTCFGKKEDVSCIKTIDIANGTTITGFYGHFAWGKGMINLGVISEYLE
ncbi:hypothetical protein LLEC1_03517 [Akanthomyces lecanii]|uniref:F-box domain-containing protein n=1 Tax=Cordyceps confragosa TaxID=2714763 RepID=A0A179I7Y9_CORDF|nr:hypothetical protein LLEC1_03517 [Akanthomyces lecanii]